MPFTLHTPSAAQYYNSDPSIWLSVDPMVDKYPNLSPYTYCADNPVRLVDPNGRTIVGTDGNDVTYSIDDKGTVVWSKNASKDTKKIGNELLKTQTGKQQLDKLVHSETRIRLNISKKDKNGNNNVTFGSFFSGQVSKESLSNNSICFLSQGLQSYIHLIVVNDNVLYVVNMRNSLTEILRSVQQNEIFDQKAIINTIKQLHKQNFDNRYSEGNIPGEIDDNGEWKPLIEYDPNKW